MTASLTGASTVPETSGASELRGAALRGVDPRTGEALDPSFGEATAGAIDRAADAAAGAARHLAALQPSVISAFLRRLADALAHDGDAIVARADAETALGHDRLTTELARTMGQIRAFAALVESGEHLEPSIDPPDGPHPDVRRMLVPIGPVAVFGASNFPLAFSVPGGDTASALAAGCPVIAKGHPAHPGTSELCARTILGVVSDHGLPHGTFALVQGASPEVSRGLVAHPAVNAVGFTGSTSVGRALFDLAAARSSPIPVYAEMGSLNPVFVTSSALATRGDDIAEQLGASIALGGGQFCTKPGLLFVPADEAGDRFAGTLAERLAATGAQPMLNERIREGFTTIVERTRGVAGVESLVARREPERPGTWTSAALLATDLSTFLSRPELVEEHFGPAAIVVRTPEVRFVDAARRIDGSLTATIHAQEGKDDALVGELLPELVARAGRIVFDGVPTGVAVVRSMQHGGPYPATTYPGFTSVGLTAIRRFLRPVAFQNAPERYLPPVLRKENG